MYEGDFLAESRHLAESIQNIANKGMLDRHGNPLYTGRIVGYVCNVYPEGDEWEGTIDVQEFNKYADDEKGADGNDDSGEIHSVQGVI